MRRFRVLLVLASLWLAPRAARGAPGPTSAEVAGAVVVSVAPDAREIDPAKMRAAVGRELGAEALDPRDPRAADARGQIDIAIDRAARQLVVRYRGGSNPIERRVDLPADAAGISREAVLLAGNLARDEARELVEQFRRKKAVEAAPTPPPAPTPPAPAAPVLSPEEQRELASDERLGRVLGAYARRDRTERMAFGWTMISAGSLAAGVGLYEFVVPSSGGQLTFLAAYGGIGVMVGLGSLWNPSDFEAWSADYASQSRPGEPRPWARADAEQRWRRRADAERFVRHGVGYAGLGLLLVDGVVTAYALPRVTGDTRDRWVAFSVGLGAVFGVAALLAFTTDGKVEARLHSYERAIGHQILLSDVTLGLAPAPGGLTGSLSGRF